MILKFRLKRGQHLEYLPLHLLCMKTPANLFSNLAAISLWLFTLVQTKDFISQMSRSKVSRGN